jgi:predicted nucleic acid-binding protein
MKEYLGDAVYLDVDEFGTVVLTTEDGYRATNRIVLEDQVMAELLLALARRVPRPEAIQQAAAEIKRRTNVLRSNP